MSKKVLRITDIKSIDKAINELKYIKSTISTINIEFMKRSLRIIQDKANENLESRVRKFPNSANITRNWKIKHAQSRYGGNAYELRNNNEVVAFVEFGTGIVGKGSPHEKAKELKYEYDIHNHGENGWYFKFDYNGKTYKYRGFKGYKGKSFLYDAFFDYFLLGEWKMVYKEIYDEYIK